MFFFFGLKITDFPRSRHVTMKVSNEAEACIHVPPYWRHCWLLMALTWAVFIGTTFCRNGRLITHLYICIVLCSGIHVQQKLLQTYSFRDAITKLCYFAHQSINLILAVIPFKVILFRALLGTGAFPGFFSFLSGVAQEQSRGGPWEIRIFNQI